MCVCSGKCKATEYQTLNQKLNLNQTLHHLMPQLIFSFTIFIISVLLCLCFKMCTLEEQITVTKTQMGDFNISFGKESIIQRAESKVDTHKSQHDTTSSAEVKDQSQKLA